MTAFSRNDVEKGTLPMLCYMDPEVVARVHILPTITYVNSVGDVVEKRSMKILYVRHTNLRSSGTQNKGSQLKPSSVRLIRTIL